MRHLSFLPFARLPLSLFPFLLSASIVPAAEVKPAMPQYTSVQQLPETVTLATLDNGLTVILQENHACARSHRPQLRQEHRQRLRGPLPSAAG